MQLDYTLATLLNIIKRYSRWLTTRSARNYAYKSSLTEIHMFWLVKGGVAGKKSLVAFVKINIGCFV